MSEIVPENNMSRSKKAFKNLFFSMFTQIITLILTFVNRSVFVKILGIEYLGISGLFTNILNHILGYKYMIMLLISKIYYV